MGVTHAAVVVVPDDGTSPVGSDEWNAGHVVTDGSFAAAKVAFSATDKVLGRSTSGAGNGEEITVTAAGRALIDDPDAAAQRATLGLTGLTKRIPIALDTPDASGNAYPALSTNNGFSNVRRVVPAFTKDVLGTWEGAIRVPADYASAGKVIISLVANATANVFRSIVSTSVVAANATEDPAYTDETAVDTTFATTAKRRVDVSTTLTTTPAANSTLNVKITHDGAHANDTLAVDCLVWECLFEYTSS